MPGGSFGLVLHSHLPWVLHHGRWPHGVDWLSEVVAASYLPLWRLLHARADAGRALLTLGLTPVLCEQLAHPDFHREFVDWCRQRIAAAVADRAAFERSGELGLAGLAARWERHHRAALEDFMGPHGPDLAARFRRLEDHGVVELVGSAATHAYLPLLPTDAAVAGQLRIGRTAHHRRFGRAPRGLWLPECGYRPAGPWRPPAGSPAPAGARAGLETLLEAEGVACFFVDAHLLGGPTPAGYADRFAAPRGDRRAAAAADAAHPPGRPCRVGAARAVSCLVRDPASALQVWSRDQGYPGDPGYLDFHKRRSPGGHRYWSVTDPRGDLADKRVYDPAAAAARAPVHAAHFLAHLQRGLAEAERREGEPALACAMFDTELFGHWWFEGPRFLAALLDGCAGGAGVTARALSGLLEHHPPRARVALREGSWGDGGGHRAWLNPGTAWLWPLVHGAALRFERLASEAAAVLPPGADPLRERLLAQGGRERLLLEASDWPFLLTTGTAGDYAGRRLAGHAADFERLATLAGRRAAGDPIAGDDEAFLAACERRDDLFPDFDWRGYTTGAGRTRVAAG